jgi:5'-nucleotidase
MMGLNPRSVVLATILFLVPAFFGCGGSGGDVLTILVTNDDGVDAPGIDVLVQGLIADPNNQVTVCAPVENQSGTGDNTDCGTGEATTAFTASNYEAVAVNGCPADAVNYALANLYPDGPPDVVLSGINAGQNVGNVNGLLSQFSGTVGAAKTAACNDVPALASSQGEGETIDYAAGLDAVLQWLADNRSALLAGDVPVETITSINIPSCDGNGEIRGTVNVPLATENPNNYSLFPAGPQDCTSTVEEVPNDIEAFYNGFVAVTPVPRNTTCPSQ